MGLDSCCLTVVVVCPPSCPTNSALLHSPLTFHTQYFFPRQPAPGLYPPRHHFCICRYIARLINPGPAQLHADLSLPFSALSPTHTSCSFFTSQTLTPLTPASLLHLQVNRLAALTLALHSHMLARHHMRVGSHVNTHVLGKGRMRGWAAPALLPPGYTGKCASVLYVACVLAAMRCNNEQLHPGYTGKYA